MEALLLLLLLLGLSGASLGFHGDSVSFTAPQRRTDGSIQVTFHRRQNGRSSCETQPYTCGNAACTCEDAACTCGNGACTSFTESDVLQTDLDGTAEQRWCQTESRVEASISTSNTSLYLRDSGCCWTSNVEGKTTWTSSAVLDLGSRSDSNALNSCPVTATVSSLRVPQNCFSEFPLLAHDPDGDVVKCRFASDATPPANFALDETGCMLAADGLVAVGDHVFELFLEDFPRKTITLTYGDGTAVQRDASDAAAPPLCRVKLQFSIQIVASIPICDLGHGRPVYLSPTPSNGDVLVAPVGQNFQLTARAQAHQDSIQDFQVSGPHSMSKVFTDQPEGQAQLTLSWTPQPRDLYRSVPVCFTAETKETQSDMRCVVVMATQSPLTQGMVSVTCSPNKMVVALEKASMPGIDVNFLQLLDSSCSLTANATHIVGVTSFTACGTELQEQGGFLVFKNQINSFVLPGEVIVRRKELKIDVSCQFPKSVSISSYFNIHKSDYVFTESSFGSFGYTFEIFTDGTFTSNVAPAAYPVEVKLLDMVYMGIQAESDLPNVSLFVESCKATPDDNPNNVIFYDLIKNGCQRDETFKIYPSNQMSYNFEVQVFKFSGNLDQVYVTCSVILCETESSFSRCSQGCLTDPSRRKRSVTKETVGHSITQGPLRFVRQAVSNAVVEGSAPLVKQIDQPAAVNPPPVQPYIKVSGGGLGFKETLSPSISTVVLASTFSVLLVLAFLIFGYFIRKRKDEDRRSLLVSGWEK